MNCKVIQTGSRGNAVIYNNVLVDCGVPFSLLKPYVEQIDFVCLTHIHKDHFNKNSLINLHFAKPSIHFLCPEWLEDRMKSIGLNPFVIELNEPAEFGNVIVSPFLLYHDVYNCGWRIMFDYNFRIIHATDTAHLDGIHARQYDVYAIEFNYDEEEYAQIVEEKRSKGEYCYEEGAMNSHLSFQQAQEFIDKYARNDSIIIKLHMSSRYKENNEQPD